MNQQLKDPLADALYRLEVQSMELASRRYVCKNLGRRLQEAEAHIRRLESYFDDGEVESYFEEGEA